MKPPPLAVRLQKAVPFRRFGTCPCPCPCPCPKRERKKFWNEDWLPAVVLLCHRLCRWSLILFARCMKSV